MCVKPALNCLWNPSCLAIRWFSSILPKHSNATTIIVLLLETFYKSNIKIMIRNTVWFWHVLPTQKMTEKCRLCCIFVSEHILYKPMKLLRYWQLRTSNHPIQPDYLFQFQTSIHSKWEGLPHIQLYRYFSTDHRSIL